MCEREETEKDTEKERGKERERGGTEEADQTVRKDRSDEERPLEGPVVSNRCTCRVLT